MDYKARQILEFPKILERLSGLAGSVQAREEILKLEVKNRIEEIRHLQSETTEALAIINVKGPLPLGNFYNIELELETAKKGGVLSMGQLLRILYNLNIAFKVISFMKSDLPEAEIIRGMTDLLVSPKELRDEIDRCILAEEEMADDASSELKHLRREIQKQNEAIRSKLNQIIASQANKAYLQDAIITLREGRYVIPVKQEHKAKLGGIVHDQSSSGATLFIEPQIIVDYNNKLRELELQEKAEILRILRELTILAGSYYQELINNQKLLVQLDIIFAKGMLSYKMDASQPLMKEEGAFKLINARHPLIDKDKVVAINLTMGEGYHSLIITGPNTGGKTVTLKTTGLLLLMAQAGLHIPADEGSSLKVFKSIYADIGDEQSIEQSLSTFSSHMNNIIGIVKNVGKDSLVLLDELGAGTDPTEGAALAISILKDLKEKGTMVLATTHYTELKKYALSEEDVENASMEFDVETLSPTYKLIMGIPGRSNAFEIAQKLGLDQGIIDSAKLLLDDNALAFEDVISSLNEEKAEIDRLKEEAILLNISMARQKKEAEALERKIQTQKEAILEGAREEAKLIVSKTREKLDEIIERAEEDLLSRGTQGTGLLKKEIKEVESALRGEKLKEPVAALSEEDEKRIVVGAKVLVRSLDSPGEVLSGPDEKGDVLVRVGQIKVTSNIKGLSIIKEKEFKKQESLKREKGKTKGEIRIKSCPLSVDVRGEDLEGALMTVEKYIDDAYLAGLRKVTIIHGRGEGILKAGLKESFKKNKHVAQFHRGSYNEGGDGVTIITLSDK